MKNRKIAIFLLVAVFILIPIALTVFGYLMYVGTSKEIEQPVIYDRHYVMITENEDSGLWDSMYESAREEGEKRGICVERFGSGLAVEYDRNQLLKMAVQASVDGIIIAGDEEEETIAGINDAVDHGIPVVTVFKDSSGSKRQCFVGSNYYHVGEAYGKQIQKILQVNPKSHTQKVLVLMGATAPRIEKAVREDPNFDPQALPILHADSMQHAVELARGAAKPGDIVSLSPASASFDLYPNFEVRGRDYKRIVNELQ